MATRGVQIARHTPRIVILLFLPFGFFTDTAIAQQAGRACRSETALLGGVLTGMNMGDYPAPEFAGQLGSHCGWADFELSADYSPVHKTSTHKGYSMGGLLLYRQNLRKGWFLALGASGRHRDAGEFAKTAFHPRVGLGWHDRSRLIELQWAFREKMTPNRVEGLVWRYRKDYYRAHKRVGLRAELNGSLIRFSEVGGNETPLGRFTAASLSFLFGVVCCRSGAEH